jgi:hypothetical protein
MKIYHESNSEIYFLVQPLENTSVIFNFLFKIISTLQGCIQKFPDWPPGARTANGTALCH